MYVKHLAEGPAHRDPQWRAAALGQTIEQGKGAAQPAQGSWCSTGEREPRSRRVVTKPAVGPGVEPQPATPLLGPPEDGTRPDAQGHTEDDPGAHTVALGRQEDTPPRATSNTQIRIYYPNRRGSLDAPTFKKLLLSWHCFLWGYF